MRRVRTAPSSTSCPASTRRASRSIPLNRPPPRTLTTITSGAAPSVCRSAAVSASSIAATTKKTLIVRVHPEFLAKQKLPPELVTKGIWKDRFQDIRNFERYLVNNGIAIRKFFLHVSKKEQKRRFLERVENPAKNWKFSASDMEERRFWNQYMEAYEDMVRNTATKEAPWFVVPADNKWFTRVVVSSVVIDALASLNLKYPEVGKEKRKELAAVRQALTKE